MGFLPNVNLRLMSSNVVVSGFDGVFKVSFWDRSLTMMTVNYRYTESVQYSRGTRSQIVPWRRFSIYSLKVPHYCKSLVIDRGSTIVNRRVQRLIPKLKGRRFTFLLRHEEIGK